jgi:hypothetical protein
VQCVPMRRMRTNSELGQVGKLAEMCAGRVGNGGATCSLEFYGRGRRGQGGGFEASVQRPARSGMVGEHSRTVKLPDTHDAVVVEGRIVADDGNLFDLSLSDKHAIERIAVVIW